MWKALPQNFAETQIPASDDDDQWFLLSKRVVNFILSGYGIIGYRSDPPPAMLNASRKLCEYYSKLGECQVAVGCYTHKETYQFLIDVSIGSIFNAFVIMIVRCTIKKDSGDVLSPNLSLLF